jgi:hypothetical protein
MHNTTPNEAEDLMDCQPTAFAPGALLKAPEVAELLRCSIDSVHRLYWRGLIEGFSMARGEEKTGGGRRSRLFLASSVHKYITEALQASAAARASRAEVTMPEAVDPGG